MRILIDFFPTLSRTKNGQKYCFARCLPHENFWKLTGMPNHAYYWALRNIGFPMDGMYGSPVLSWWKLTDKKLKRAISSLKINLMKTPKI